MTMGVTVGDNGVAVRVTVGDDGGDWGCQWVMMGVTLRVAMGDTGEDTEDDSG